MLGRAHVFLRLTFGWYESIFASYMARKVCKFSVRKPLLTSYPASKGCHFYGWVNSFTLQRPLTNSAGEQSVGKSYALNHFVDTSFAGSAMRCTEGVWLSVTPTHNALIVSMDFEGMNFIMLYPCLMLSLGVNSIERSAQEGVLARGIIPLLFTTHGRYATRTLQCGDFESCTSLEFTSSGSCFSSLVHRSYSAITLLCLGTSPTRSRYVFR